MTTRVSSMAGHNLDITGRRRRPIMCVILPCCVRKGVESDMSLYRKPLLNMDKSLEPWKTLDEPRFTSPIQVESQARGPQSLLGKPWLLPRCVPDKGSLRTRERRLRAGADENALPGKAEIKSARRGEWNNKTPPEAPHGR